MLQHTQPEVGEADNDYAGGDDAGEDDGGGDEDEDTIITINIILEKMVGNGVWCLYILSSHVFFPAKRT